MGSSFSSWQCLQFLTKWNDRQWESQSPRFCRSASALASKKGATQKGCDKESILRLFEQFELAVCGSKSTQKTVESWFEQD